MTKCKIKKFGKEKINEKLVVDYCPFFNNLAEILRNL